MSPFWFRSGHARSARWLRCRRMYRPVNACQPGDRVAPADVECKSCLAAAERNELDAQPVARSPVHGRAVLALLDRRTQPPPRTAVEARPSHARVAAVRLAGCSAMKLRIAG